MGIVEGPVGPGPAGSVFGENLFYREIRGTRRGGRHVAKCSSDPRVSYPEVKVQVRDLVRVVDIVAPFTPQLQETCAGCHQQRYTTGEPGKVQGWDRVGIVEWSLSYRARGVSIREKFVLSRNSGYKTRVVALWLNVVLTPV